MPYIGYALVAVICTLTALAVFGKINEKWFPFILYGTAASVVLMTTLAGDYLTGSDIRLEYYYAKLYSGEDVPLPIVNIPQGTSIANTFLPSILPIPTLWLFKLVYPLLFCTIPVMLYFIFKTWFTPIQAFLAAFFFITFPAFIMEIPGIARQMTAEVALVALLYLLIVSKLRNRWRVPLIAVCGALIPLFHYSIAVVTPILLFAALVFKWHRKAVLAALGCLVIVSAVYFPLAENGAVFRKLVHSYNAVVPTVIDIPVRTLPPDLRPEGHDTFPPSMKTEPPKPVQSFTEKVVTYVKRHESVIQVGLGLDFMKTTLAGKIFRIVQWAILALMIVGLWRLRRNKSYWIFASGGVLLLAMVAIPSFSGFFNITRLFHIALIVLAPLLAVALRPRYILAILLVYFLFTSGFIFEVTKHPDISEITVPYSAGMSNYRVDLGASATKDDYKTIEYMIDNELWPSYSDMYGTNLIGEEIGFRGDINRALQSNPPPRPCYVFVRGRSYQEGILTIWNGIGLRRSVKPEHYGFSFTDNVIYKSGNTRILELK